MNGPYVVFDDNSTYAADGYIAFISDKAQEILEDTVDFKHIEYELGGELGVEDVKKVWIQDLLAAYDKVHGTNLLSTGCGLESSEADDNGSGNE